MIFLDILGAFIIGFLVDYLWAKYIIATARFQHHRASMYSVAIGFAGIILITNIVQSNYLIVAWLIGLYAGTYYSLKHAKR